MQYHAVSFAREGFTVDVIGYPGSPPMREICENPRVRIYYLRPFPDLRDSTYWTLPLPSSYRFQHSDLFSRFSIFFISL